MAETHGVRRIALDKLQFDPDNARLHPADNLAAIRASLAEFGQPEALVVQEQTLQVVAGNGRLQAMRDLGWDKCWVRIVAWDAKRCRAYSVASNRTGELSTWDSPRLAVQLDGLRTDYDLTNLGFDQAALDDLFDAEAGDALGDEGADDDNVPEPPATPITRPSDLWRIGEHRLLCGDSLRSDVLGRLVGDDTIGLLFTDPPYGMGLDTDFDGMFSNDPTHRKTGHRHKAVVGDDKPFDPTMLFQTFARVPEMVLWGADYYRRQIPDGGSWYVWDKRCDEQMDKVIGNVFELAWSKRSHKREVCRLLWSGHHGMQGDDTGKRHHPTQKPVALVRWFFERIKGQVVADVFAGSGSTLVACAREGRRGVMCEIEPAYCDVIVERMQQLTGEKAKREPAP